MIINFEVKYFHGYITYTCASPRVGFRAKIICGLALSNYFQTVVAISSTINEMVHAVYCCWAVIAAG